MTIQLCQGIVSHKPSTSLSGEVECDEVYIVAGHKGQPEAVAKKGEAGGEDGCEKLEDSGILESEKPPIFGVVPGFFEFVRHVRQPGKALLGALLELLLS